LYYSNGIGTVKNGGKCNSGDIHKRLSIEKTVLTAYATKKEKNRGWARINADCGMINLKKIHLIKNPFHLDKKKLNK